MESSYRNRKISFSTKYERARSPLLFSASLVLVFSFVSFFQLMLARAASFELLSLYELVQWVLNWSTRHFVSIIGEIHVILFKCSFIQAVFISQVFLFLVCFFLIYLSSFSWGSGFCSFAFFLTTNFSTSADAARRTSVFYCEGHHHVRILFVTSQRAYCEVR